MALIEIEGLYKSYNKLLALNNLNLSLEGGQIVGLLGPNGSGKTTLIKILNDLLKADRGSILIDGKNPSTETKEVVAYLPDRNSLPDYMKIKDLINMQADFFKDFDIEKANSMIEDLGINTNMRFKSLSKGMGEKVQLALVMSRKAKVYLLDEPIGGVDPAARDYILKTIISNYNPESVVIISTHLISEIESVLDDVIFIKNGEIVLHKSPDLIREEYAKGVDELFREVFKC
ncbi:ATP-binding cassette domain-containing protein [Alterileibacterium massiliense]|uniref:ATP-binding cassette domain-containing protein n=1 Tax=Alterileibacterium massiliense TaxID=1870997 RepID=UPI0008D9AA03|nr:ABC transporter ATP-binding protein [Alterileibacterium massiliense]